MGEALPQPRGRVLNAAYGTLTANFVLTGIMLMIACAALGWLVVARPEFKVKQ